MQKCRIVIFTLFFALSGCCFIHKMDIEQGNIITTENANRLHTGMTITDVTDLLGSPVLLNTFADNRVNYVYTYKPGNSSMSEKYITLTFKNNRLTEISGNMR